MTCLLPLFSIDFMILKRPILTEKGMKMDFISYVFLKEEKIYPKVG